MVARSLKDQSVISQSSGSKTDAEALEIGWKIIFTDCIDPSTNIQPTIPSYLKAYSTHKHDIGHNQ